MVTIFQTAQKLSRTITQWQEERIGGLCKATLFFPCIDSRGSVEGSGVLKLRNDLVRLRRGVKQWAAAVALLLVVIVGLVIWLMQWATMTE